MTRPRYWDLGGIGEGSLSKAEAEFKEAQASLEAKKAEVEALKKALDQARETGYPKEAYAKDVDRYFAAVGELQKAQAGVLAPSAKLYGTLIDPARPRPDEPVRQPPLQAVDPSQIPVHQAMERLRQAQESRDVGKFEVERAKVVLEEGAARAELATKRVARMEELLAKSAIEQRLVDDARDERAAALSDRQSAEARLRYADVQLRFDEAEVTEAQKLLDVVSEPGPDTPQKRETILLIHAETALRRAQADRDHGGRGTGGVQAAPGGCAGQSRLPQESHRAVAPARGAKGCRAAPSGRSGKPGKGRRVQASPVPARR